MISRQETGFLIFVLALAAGLVLPGLGASSLWQDEGQTAVIASNIVETGIPYASDGRNLVSILPGHKDIRDGIYIWQPWLPTYIAAASLGISGHSAFAARLPFALSFIALVGIAWWFFRRWGHHLLRAQLTAFLMAGSVVLLLHARQCRYYMLIPLFSLLVTDAWLRVLARPGPQAAALLVLWFSLLFNSFYPAAVLLAGALGIHLLVTRRDPRVYWILALAALAFLVINLPIAWYCRIWDRQFGAQPGYSDLEVFWYYLARYTLTINNYFFPLALVLAAALVHWRRITCAAIVRNDIVFLCITICITQLLGFALLSDYPFTRYLIGTAPFLTYLGVMSIERLAFGKKPVIWILTGLVFATNLPNVLPLFLLQHTAIRNTAWTTAGIDTSNLRPDMIGVSFARGEIGKLIGIPAGSPLLTYTKSIIDPPSGPVDEIVRYLVTHAKPTDRVKIAYGDIALMFHTDLKVVSGSQTGDPAPEWLIYRHFSPMIMDGNFRRQTDRYAYSRVELPVTDVQWNNWPDPLYHNFVTPQFPGIPHVTLLRRNRVRLH